MGKSPTTLALQSFCFLSSILLIGSFLRAKFRLLSRLYLPISVISGFVGLIILQAVDAHHPGALKEWTVGWSEISGFLINIVFASLFLGVDTPSPRVVWDVAAAQFCYGLVVSWGQYVLGLGLGYFVLMPLFGVNRFFGIILPVGFEGGHGTAAALGEVMNEFGFEDGESLSLASATFGLVGAIILGMFFVNLAIRKNWLRSIPSDLESAMELKRDEGQDGEGFTRESVDLSSPVADEFSSRDSLFLTTHNRPIAGEQSISQDIMDSLTLHLMAIAMSVFFGLACKEILVAIENSSDFLTKYKFLSGFPLFPFAMLGGIFVQYSITQMTSERPLNSLLVNRLSGASLDYLVVGAISSMNVATVWENIGPFVILMVVGVIWHIICLLYICPRMVPNFWFERAIAELGQGMGVTATGLLLLRTVDPENQTPVLKAFSYTQLLFEPILGGGLWTACVVPLMGAAGVVAVFVTSTVAMLLSLLLWHYTVRKHIRPTQYRHF